MLKETGPKSGPRRYLVDSPKKDHEMLRPTVSACHSCPAISTALGLIRTIWRFVYLYIQQGQSGQQQQLKKRKEIPIWGGQIMFRCGDFYQVPYFT